MNTSKPEWYGDANWQIDAGLLFLHVSGAALLFTVHGLPKALHYTQELTRTVPPRGQQGGRI